MGSVIINEKNGEKVNIQYKILMKMFPYAILIKIQRLLK